MRITKSRLELSVTSINCALANRSADYTIKLVGQYGKQSVYLMKEDRMIKMLFIGTCREVYHYLWGAFDMIINIM